MLKTLLLIVLLLPSFAYSREIALGYFNLSPHIYQNEDKEATGPLVEFLNQHISPEMGVTFTFSYMPLARILQKMEHGELLGSALLGYTQQREHIIDYPKNSFYIMRPVIAVRNDSPLKEITSPDDLKNLDIGYFNSGLISPYMESNEIQFIKINGLNPWVRNLNKLILNRLDAIYSPIGLNMVHTAKEHNLLDKINIISIPENPMRLYTAFPKTEFYPELNLAAKYDQAFEKIDGLEVYIQLLEKYTNNAE